MTAGLQDGWNRTRLRKVEGTIYIDRPNTVMRDACVERVVVRAPGFKATNVMTVGGGHERSNVGLFDFTHAGAAGTLENVTIRPDRPNLWLTGVLGHDYIARSVHVRHTVDGFGIYDTHHKSNPVNVTIDHCDVDELAYFTGDPNHPDRRTHNDAVQIQGGSHITITASRLHAFAARDIGNYDRDPYRPAVTGQAIGVTPNVSRVSWLHVEGNDIDGGAQSITLIPGKFGATNVGSIIGNTFGRGQANIRKGVRKARRPAIAHPSMSVTWKNNTYVDGTAAKLVTTRNV